MASVWVRLNTSSLFSSTFKISSTFKLSTWLRLAWRIQRSSICVAYWRIDDRCWRALCCIKVEIPRSWEYLFHGQRWAIHETGMARKQLLRRSRRIATKILAHLHHRAFLEWARCFYWSSQKMQALLLGHLIQTHPSLSRILKFFVIVVPLRFVELYNLRHGLWYVHYQRHKQIIASIPC